MIVKMVKTTNGYQIRVGSKIYFFKFSKALEDVYNIYIKSESENKVARKVSTPRLRKTSN